MLNQVHIVKGWVDRAGQTHEKVYLVAGDPGDAGSVDLRSCTPLGTGAADFCAVWRDPDFDPAQHAFYYARALENLSCRTSQFLCSARQVECRLRPAGCTRGSTAARCTPYEAELCCGSAIPKTVQQRAWSSPIWYSPAAR